MRKAPLKIGYFADGIWAQNALRQILKNKNFQICFVVPRFQTPDNALLTLAKSYKIPIITSKNVNSADFIAQIQAYECELLVSMSFNQIFKQELLSRYPIINCHAGKLPFYRGRNILNWALINDEKEFGISVHFVDSGIDTGDIIIQKSYAINDSDDYSSLLKVAYKECAILLYESLNLFLNDEIRAIKQESIDKIGSYCPPRKKGNEIIDFSKSVREIFNFIRALNAPDLGALAFVGEEPIYLYKSQILDIAFDINLPNGFILGVYDKSFSLKLKNGVLQITQYAFNGKLKQGLILTNTAITNGGGGKNIKL